MQATSGREEGFRLFPTIMVMGLVLLAAGQVYLLQEVRKLNKTASEGSQEITSEAAQKASQNTANLGTDQRARFPGHRSASYENPSARGQSNLNNPAPAGAQSADGQHPQALANLAQRLNELSRAVQQQTSGARAVAEYNVMNPAVVEEPITEPVQQKRSWGQEQVVGAPDTPTASDAPTAWASRDQDAGPEWLQLDFENAVDVAEVRIRESYNPGAISKVTGVVNGQEVTLWEGTAQGGAAPRDFVVPVEGNLQANSVVVHLDTARVPGWNEIDAVELIGKDGSRQWATSSSASSTYAEHQHGPPRPNQVGFDADGTPTIVPIQP